MESIEFEVRIIGTLDQGVSPEVAKAKIAYMAQNIGEVSLTEIVFRQNMNGQISGSAGMIPQNTTTEGLDAQVSRSSWTPEPSSLHWRLLSEIHQEPSLNSKELTRRLNLNEATSVSRAGAKLSVEGYVTKQKVGRMVLWETTSLGANYLESNNVSSTIGSCF